MGYYANGGGTFKISKKNFEPMKAAVQDWVRKEQPGWEADPDIECFFDYFGFEADLDDDGNIWYVSFPDNKIRDAADFLKIIAPWVEDGSRIEMVGEDFSAWLWAFKDHEFYECNGTVVYEGDPYGQEDP